MTTQPGEIVTFHAPPFTFDKGFLSCDTGLINNSVGTWTIAGQVPETGSTLSLMTLTLMALGLVARRFQRAAG